MILKSILKKYLNTQIFWYILIVLLGFTCYFNSLSGKFIWDDFYLIVSNPIIKNISNIGKIFATELLPNSNYYRPIQTLTYLFDYHIYNLNFWGYHLTSLIIHIVNSLIVFLLIKKITANHITAVITSLFFVCAPIHSEAVAYISGRADLLSAFFVLLSFLFYTKQKIVAALILFILALFSREGTLVLPCIFIVYDFLAMDRKARCNNRKYYTYFFLIILAYALLRMTVLNLPQKNIFLNTRICFNIGFIARLATFIKGIITYLGIIVYSINFHLDRAFLVASNFYNFYTIIFLSITLFISLVIKKIKSGGWLIIFGISWFLIFLFPQSNFIFPLTIAEHFLYLPSLGFFLVLAVIIEKLWHKRKQLVTVLLILGIFYYSFITISYNINWRDPLNFYRWTLKFSPGNNRMRYLLGNYYAEMGMVDLALEEYKKAIALDNQPQEYKTKIDLSFFKANKKFLPVFHHNLGVMLASKGLIKEAAEEYKKAIAIKPDLAESYNDLGCLYISQNRLEEAKEIFTKVLTIVPKFYKAYYNLGIIYAQSGDNQKAITAFSQALAINPEYNLAKENIARLTNGK